MLSRIEDKKVIPILQRVWNPVGRIDKEQLSSLRRLATPAVLLLLVLVAIPTSAQAQGLFQQEYPLDLQIEPLSWEILVLDCIEGGNIEGSFQVTSGVNVTFFIVDRTEFELWRQGQTADIILFRENVTRLSWQHGVTSADQYYLVFQNPHTVGWAHVEGMVYVVGPPLSVGQSIGLTLGVVILIVAVWAALYRRVIQYASDLDGESAEEWMMDPIHDED